MSEVGRTVDRMSTITERIAKITQADLGWEDHGILTTFIQLDYGTAGGSQGAAGYSFDRSPLDGRYERAARIGTAFGMTFVMRLMDAAGVDRWSKMKGRTVIAIVDDGMVRGLKPLPTEPGVEFRFDELAEDFDDKGNAL